MVQRTLQPSASAKAPFLSADQAARHVPSQWYASLVDGLCKPPPGAGGR